MTLYKQIKLPCANTPVHTDIASTKSFFFLKKKVHSKSELHSVQLGQRARRKVEAGTHREVPTFLEILRLNK